MATTKCLVFLCASLMVLMANSYKDEDLDRFGYTGNIAPEKWGSLSPRFFMCSKGTRQSPINILTKDLVYDPKLESLDRNYRVANGSLYDNGFNVELRYAPTVGTLFCEGRNYTFKQMHWHFPSEHTIDGKRFPVELHMVHSDNEERFAVVAILYKFGGTDPLVEKLLPYVEELNKRVGSGDTDARIPIEFLKTDYLKKDSNTYYRYVGSVSTPPCSEPVIWNVLARVREMSVEQATKLRAPLPEGFHVNARPVQPLHGRTVRLYKQN